VLLLLLLLLLRLDVLSAEEKCLAGLGWQVERKGVERRVVTKEEMVGEAPQGELRQKERRPEVYQLHSPPRGKKYKAPRINVHSI
jgi:hypothetical protein